MILKRRSDNILPQVASVEESRSLGCLHCFGNDGTVDFKFAFPDLEIEKLILMNYNHPKKSFSTEILKAAE